MIDYWFYFYKDAKSKEHTNSHCHEWGDSKGIATWVL